MLPDPHEIVLRLLNDAHAADPAAMHALFCAAVPVNDLLANHEHIIVEPLRLAASEPCLLTLMGVVNGILSALGSPAVASRWDNGFLIGFTSYPTSARDGTPT